MNERFLGPDTLVVPRHLNHAYINNYINPLLCAKFQSGAHFSVINLSILEFIAFTTTALSLLILIGASLRGPSRGVM